MSIENINEFLNYLLRKARNLASDAAHSGAMNDGGAGRLEDAVNAYIAGMNGYIPDSFKKDYEIFLRQQDPEYLEFLRLKQKFGEK